MPPYVLTDRVRGTSTSKKRRRKPPKRGHVDIIMVVAGNVAPFDWPRALPLIYDVLRWFDLVLCVLCAAVLWYGWVAKYFMENPAHFGHFLTNWSWVAETVYFTVKTAALVFGSRHLMWFVQYFLFWPIWINAWAVMLLVIAVLFDSPGLVTDMFKDFGAGTVLAADRVYHVLTAIVMIIDFCLSLKDHFGWWYLKTGSVWLLIFFEWLVAHLIVLTYLALNNIRSVYSLHHIYWWTMFLMYEPVALIAGVLFMFMCSEFRKLGGLDFYAA